MSARSDVDGTPGEFVSAVEQVRHAVLRPEVVAEEMPAPQRIAPYSYAMTGDVVFAGDNLGDGRFILLHDPSGNDAWHGTFRCVTFARADIDPEMAADPMLPEVGWSWLTEALERKAAHLIAPSGSVTVVHSEGFGGMDEDGANAQIEVRASWTPLTAKDLHVAGWSDLLCTLAGLPPLTPGVIPLPNRRGQR